MAADLHHQDWHPRHSPWLVAVGVMLATFMQVLDTSIANIALPHIAGSLSSSTDESTWVLTSYLISNAIVLPMTGWLGNRFGRKKVLISCIGMFTLASVLCGMALNLPMLIASRILQGAGGGAMVPIAQAILLESFPPNKRGVAMATFSLAVIVAPIVGPTLGGWITDNYSWRWIFYINLPVGVLAMFLAEWLVEDPPYIKRNLKAKFDALGFGLLTVWLATLQVVLDKGQEADWFAAVWIRWFTVASVSAFIGFILWELRADHPLVNLRIFGSRNFRTGVMLMGVLGLILYATTAELPLRVLLGTGFFLLSVSVFWLGNINLEVSMSNVILPIMLNGMATPFIFVPLTTATMSQLRQRDIGSGTGLYNLVMNLGGSVGIAFVTTMIARGAQAHQALMVGHLTPTDSVFNARLAAAQHALAQQSDPVTASHQAYAAIYGILNAQAHLWAFVDNFRIFGVIVFCCLPLVLLFKRVKHPPVRQVVME